MLRGPLYLLLLSILKFATGIDNLRVAFQWKKLDFHFQDESARYTAMMLNNYIPVNNVPVGLEVYEDRIFITIPRWRKGVAASLGYIKISDPMDSPRVYPYPNWEAHEPLDGTRPREIESPFRMRADKCGKLWVMDSCAINIIDEGFRNCGPKLLIYDLQTDELIRKYEIPTDQKTDLSFFANIVVEENNCTNSFAYMADISQPAMVVYSYETNTSWIVKHHYFNIDPIGGNMTVGGENFLWADGLFGMALAPRDDGFSTMYFHAMCSFNEFKVSTEVLRDRKLLENESAAFKKFELVGSRGNKGQSGSSFYHEKSKVLFHAMLQLNAVTCWKTTNPSYTIYSHGGIYMNNETLVFPSDLKVDAYDGLWVLSDQLPIFMYSHAKMEQDENNYHFRILNATVEEAIKDTACDSKMIITTERSISSSAINRLHIGLMIVMFAILFK